MELNKNKVISTEAEQEAFAKNQQTERDQNLEDLRFILSTPAGVRFFKRFFDEGKMFVTTFTGNSQSYWLEGHRNFALKYFHEICEAAPDKVTELIMRKF